MNTPNTTKTVSAVQNVREQPWIDVVLLQTRSDSQIQIWKDQMVRLTKRTGFTSYLIRRVRSFDFKVTTAPRWNEPSFGHFYGESTR